VKPNLRQASLLQQPLELPRQVAASKWTAAGVAEQPPASVKLTKQLIKQGVAQIAEQTMDAEGAHFTELLASADAREALTAFIEKRKPVFANQ